MDRYSYIKSLLIRNKIKHKELAKELDVSRSVVSQVVGGHCRSRRIEEHIAKRLGRSYAKLWG